jgi:putative peptide zinc metalloprotease protein
VKAPQLRTDLSFTEQRYRGETVWVVKDATARRYFRFGQAEVRVMRAFDGLRTPEEIAALVAEHGTRPSADAIAEFAGMLAGVGLLERSMTAGTTVQPERLRGEPDAGGRLFRGDLLRMRWSFGDPDALLTRTLPRIRWMFTPTFLAASVVLFAGYLLVLGQRWREYATALQSVYSPEAITITHGVVFVVTALVIILIHELGHAFTCKYFGGEVREIGFMLLYFQPAFYCDVSDAWTFSERRARFWVTAAGSWIQLVAAALAALVWWAAVPGTLVAEVSAAAMLVGGVMTLLTNMNPLLPLDGYFALSDWLDIPNLRQRASAHLGWWVRHTVFRLEPPEPQASQRERRILLIYGALSAVYATLTLGILFGLVLAWANRSFGVIGVLAVATVVVLLMRRGFVAWMRSVGRAVRTHRALRQGYE